VAPERLAVPGDPAVRGIWHPAARPDGLVLTHGAGGTMDTPLLVAVAHAFVAQGVSVLRCDLPYRQARATGPPSPRDGARDRAGLAAAVAVVRARVSGRVFLGGHSYGGRMASMLAAEDPDLARGLLLQSYPLHPPGKPADLRTEHLPRIRIPTLFVHGTADPFATVIELDTARILIPAPTAVLTLTAGHDLGWTTRLRDPTLPHQIATTFLDHVGTG
jgi:predicted alpha/beta-hydrolase family hydrolase